VTGSDAPKGVGDQQERDEPSEDKGARDFGAEGELGGVFGSRFGQPQGSVHVILLVG
jgi:hypothetical protein